MKAQHTPGPYKVSSKYGTSTDKQNYIIADVILVAIIAGSDSLADEQDEANARFIVRACNAHDELVRILKMIAYEPVGPMDVTHTGALKRIAEIARIAYVKATQED